MLPSFSRPRPFPARRHLRLLRPSLQTGTLLSPTSGKSIPAPPPHPSDSPHLSTPRPSYNGYIATLRSSVAAKALRLGRQLHARLLVSGLGLDAALATRLVDLYASCVHVPNTRCMFDGMPQRNVFVWNVLIWMYVWDGPHEEAIGMYRLTCFAPRDKRILRSSVVPAPFPDLMSCCHRSSSVSLSASQRQRIESYVGIPLGLKREAKPS
jgi:hypothetical protein